MKLRSLRTYWQRNSLAIGTLLVMAASSILFPAMRAASAPAQLSVLVWNINAAGQQITKFDVNGHSVDAHDGDLAYFAGKYYFYGTAYTCGFELQTARTPFCGFKSYSSADLVNWVDDGYLFNPQGALWQARCTWPRYGCFRPHVLFNQQSNRYVLWINTYDDASGYRVFTSTTPQGPYTEIAPPTVADQGLPNTLVNGDFDLFQDDDGQAYIVYTFIHNLQGRHHSLRVQKLNNGYTSGVGAAISPGADLVEAPSLFRNGSTYYLVYGPGCAYCGGTTTLYKAASNPMSGWSAPRQINGNSCGGQPSFVAKLPTDSGYTYLFGSDLWNPAAPNQALANFFWAPLVFSGPTIAPLACLRSTTVPLRPGAVIGLVVGPPDVDQTSGMNNFTGWCDIQSFWTRSQSFTVGRSGVLATVQITTFQAHHPNSSLVLTLYRANPNGTVTGGALYAQTIHPASVPWSPRNLTIRPNLIVTAGHRYAIVASSPTTRGCYGTEYNNAHPYPAGSEYYLYRGRWTAEPGRSLKFLTTVD